MIHYKLEQRLLGGDLLAAYPHSPEDVPASIQDYLEDMLSQGYALVTTLYIGTPITFVFKVVAQ